MRTFRAQELAELIERPALIDYVNEWLRAGKGVAVYTNHDMGSADVGHHKFLSFGTPEAQFETTPPEQLPDFPGQVNWRYRLDGVYRGAEIEPPSAHEFIAPPEVLGRMIRAFGPASWDRQHRSRLVRYGLEVVRFAHGPSRVRFTLNVTQSIDDEPRQVNDVLLGDTDIVVTTWTNDDGRIDVLSPFSWSISRDDGFSMTGSDPNLGATDVAIHNNSMRKDES